MAKRKGNGLSAIKKRLRKGTMTRADLKKIASMISAAEKSVKSLRAAVIE